jgi:hypothetical protein
MIEKAIIQDADVKRPRKMSQHRAGADGIGDVAGQGPEVIDDLRGCDLVFAMADDDQGKRPVLLLAQLISSEACFARLKKAARRVCLAAALFDMAA